MANAINVGGIVADLQVDSTHLERGLANARKALDATESEMKQLHEELMRGSISFADYANRVSALTRVETELTAAMNAAYSATTKLDTGLEVVNAGAGKLSTASGRAGMALMQFGNIIDDIQYGFMGVVNNIGPLAFALSGGNMSVAAGAQVAAVATYQLYNRWNDIQAIFGNTTPLEQAAETVKGITEELKRLREEAERTPRDGIIGKLFAKQEQFDRNSRAESAAKQMENFQTEQQRKDSQRFEQAIGENGGIKKLSQILGKQMLDRAGPGAFLTPGEAKDLKFFDQQANDESLDSFFREEQRSKAEGLKQKAQMNAINRARRKIGEAKTSELARDQLAASFNASPDVFGDLGGVISGDLETDQEIQTREKRERERGIKEARNAKKEKDRQQQLMIQQQADIDTDNLRHAEAFQKEQERKKREESDFDANAENVFKQAVNETKDMVPGADKIAQFATMQGMLGNPAAVQMAQKQIKAAMQAQGINEGVAADAVDELFKDADKKTKEDVLNEVLNGGGENDQKATKSQQFDVMELAARVQQGVGGDEPKKQTGLMKQMVKSLANIERAKAGLWVDNGE